MGFPLDVWFDVERVAAGYTGVFCSLIDQVIGFDPEYFDLFWSEPGYLGADLPESLAAARVQHDTTISQVVLQSEATELGLPMSMSAMFGDSEHDMPAALRLADMPEGNLQGASLILNSGDGKGAMLHIAQVIGDLVMTGFGENNFDAMRRFKAGDEVQRGQLDLPRLPDLPPPPGARHRGVPDLRPVLLRRRAHLPPAARDHRLEVRPGRRRLDPDRSLRREDDRGRGDDGRDLFALAGRLVPVPGAGVPGRATSTTTTGSGSSSTPCTPRPACARRPSPGADDASRLLRRRAPAGAPRPERLGRERPGPARLHRVRGGGRPDRGARHRGGAQEHPGGGHRGGQRRHAGGGRGRRGRRVHRRDRGAAGHGHDRDRRVGLRGGRRLPPPDRGPRRLRRPACGCRRATPSTSRARTSRPSGSPATVRVPSTRPSPGS